MKILKESNIPLNLVNKGKVREIYDAGDNLLVVTSDRISAFDVIMDEPIPYKGVMLNQISKYWFRETKSIITNHFISDEVDTFPDECSSYKEDLEGRSMLVLKAEPLPIEFVVRGYIAGSGWNSYLEKGEICGNQLPAGLEKYDQLPEPIFTPARKAKEGHDENITYDSMVNVIGVELSEKLRDVSIHIYKYAWEKLYEQGIILADTKFEFGLIDDSPILIDEVLTPDSSRFWLKDKYEPGKEQFNFDKQILRDYLDNSDWDKNPPAPKLPEQILNSTNEKYKFAYEAITGNKFII